MSGEDWSVKPEAAVQLPAVLPEDPAECPACELVEHCPRHNPLSQLAWVENGFIVAGGSAQETSQP